MSLKNKLQRMKGHLVKEKPPESRLVEEENTNTASTTIQLDHIPFLEQWTELGAAPYGAEDDFVMVREVRYPSDSRHGRYTFSQVHDVMEAWGEAGINHPLSTAGKSVENLLFFDTETTGLHGGAGNTIFLLGYSRLEKEEVVVRQHFLAGPHAEATLYQSFLADVVESKDLVTFNGKSFDWPQVKTRHTMVRDQVPDLPVFGHYDLLHGARRLWKNELESCRLSMIEQVKLGVTRQDDVPGFMAPLLYFDYLTDKNPQHISGVLTHNEIDVLSLITLYIHLSKLLLETERQACSPDEWFEMARWYEAVGADHVALSRYEQVIDSKHYLTSKAKLAAGLLYKKQNQWQRALQIWEDSLKDSAPASEAILLEAAKIYEHQVKDYEKALAYTKQGMELMQKKGQLLRRNSKSERASYLKRIERLEKKLQRESISFPFMGEITTTASRKLEL